jgi:putative transcriptional regulator
MKVIMSKLSESILRGAKEALSYAEGHKRGYKLHKIEVPKQVNVRDIRDKLHMTRREFADQFGFSIRTLEKWEQGIRQPEGAARAFLVVIEKAPKAEAHALSK